MISKECLIEYAHEIGLDVIGFTDAKPFDRFHSELELRKERYQKRYDYRLAQWTKMATPTDVLESAKSVVVIGYNYYTHEDSCPPECGRFARIVSYGHLGILLRAKQMVAFLKKNGCQAVMSAHRKEAAVRAGLGCIGKNNLVIHPEFGTWVAYQTLITDALFEPDAPFEEDLCGRCDLCLKKCPTGALYEPRRLDPQRCVPYMLTLHDASPEFREQMSNYILGCDQCQDICPRNKDAVPRVDVDSLFPDDVGLYPPLKMLLELDEETFLKEVIGPIQRKVMPGVLAQFISRIQWLSALFQWFARKVLKGKEKLPETFVHASGSLEVYQRNAIVAAANMQYKTLIPDIRKCLTNVYLADTAKWALEKMGESA